MNDQTSMGTLERDSRRRLDPRTKLALACGFAALLMLTSNTAMLSLQVVAVILVVGISHLTAAWLHTLRVLLPMTAFLVAIMLFSLDWVSAVTSALRLIAMTTAFFVLFKTTAPEAMGNSLVKMGVPYVFAFILTTSMQFIPVLSRRMQEIMDAQRSRGIRLERDLASVPNYPALYAPLLIQSFTMADRLAEAMEARGFGRPHRTFDEEFSWAPLDYVLFLFSMAMPIAGWFLK